MRSISKNLWFVLFLLGVASLGNFIVSLRGMELFWGFPVLAPVISGLLIAWLGIVLFYYLWPRAGLIPLLFFHFLAGNLLIIYPEVHLLEEDRLKIIFSFLLVWLPPLIFHFSYLISELMVGGGKFLRWIYSLYLFSLLLGVGYYFLSPKYPFLESWWILFWLGYALLAYLFFLGRLAQTFRRSSFEIDRTTARFLLLTQGFGLILPYVLLLVLFFVGVKIPSWLMGTFLFCFPVTLFIGFIPAKRWQRETHLSLDKKRKRFGDLLGGLAHELNNPLNFLYSNLDPLKESIHRLSDFISPPNVKAKETLEDLDRMINDMEEGVSRSIKLIENFRHLPEKPADQKQKIDLNQLIDRTINLLSHKWKDRITIERNYGKIPEIFGHPIELGQVFTNLIANACDATEQGIVSVTTQDATSGVKVFIRDTGQGIPNTNLTRVFDPFFTTKAQGKGTGLGLAITLEIIKNHNGNIEVKSAVGKGTEFLVFLPY